MKHVKSAHQETVGAGAAGSGAAATPAKEDSAATIDSLLLSSRFADVLFFVEGRSCMPAHSVVVALASPVLEELIYGGRQTAEEDGKVVDPRSRRKRDEVEISDVKAEVFELLLTIIYTKKAPPTLAMACITELAEVANRFQVAGAQAVIRQSLLAHLDVASAWSMLASVHNTPYWDLVWRFILSFLPALLVHKTFLDLSPELLGTLLDSEEISHVDEKLLLDAVRWWGKEQVDRRAKEEKPPTLAEVVKPFIYKLRPTMLNFQTVALTLVPLNVLKTEELVSVYQYVSCPPELKDDIKSALILGPRLGVLAESKILTRETARRLHELLAPSKLTKFTLQLRGSRDGFTMSSLLTAIRKSNPTVVVMRIGGHGSERPVVLGGVTNLGRDVLPYLFSLENAAGRTLKAVRPANSPAALAKVLPWSDLTLEDPLDSTGNKQQLEMTSFQAAPGYKVWDYDSLGIRKVPGTTVGRFNIEEVEVYSCAVA